jgi:putative ABC transport system ATP-binding protein
MVLLEHVGKRYDGAATAVTALDDVNLEVDQGEFVVVLGPSGSGKTTLLNVIGALDTVTEGTVTVAGMRVSGARRRDLFGFRREHVSFVFQSFNLFPGLTALENVRFGVDVSRPPDVDTLTAARTALADVGLGDRGDHFPHELSGGEQQRVAIARALATGNPIILADEPTGELDFRTGVQILALLQRQAELGKTVLVVTHNREISRIADRVVELSSGRVVRDGSPVGGRATVADLHW